MSGAGIDYGRGLVNIDTNTGIRYGVVSARSVQQVWWDAAEAVYPDCDDCPPGECDCDLIEPIGFTLDDGKYQANSGTDGFGIFITKSPYYMLARFCSPCAPGAGDCNSPDPVNGVKTYCFGPDWYEEGEAPEMFYAPDGPRKRQKTSISNNI